MKQIVQITVITVASLVGMGIFALMVIGDDARHAIVGAKALAGSPPKARPAAQAAPAKTWHEVETFSGDGIVDTDDFRITGRKWRITYLTEKTQDSAVFQIYVYGADGVLKGVAANTQSAGKGESVQRGAGEYYLKVNSFGVNWAVVVEEER